MPAIPDLAPTSEAESKPAHHDNELQPSAPNEKRPESPPQALLEPPATITESSPPSYSTSPNTNLTSGASTPLPKPPHPPPLPYSLAAHKTSITIIWTLLLLDTAILPLALFYPLWYGTTIQPWVVIAITSSIFGVISGAEWCYRTYLLLRHEHLRPIGSRGWWCFDVFHWVYSIGYGIALIELIYAAYPDYPLLRLYSTPTPTFTLYFGLLFLLPPLFPPFPTSTSIPLLSLPRRPLTYTITADVIAVDTHSGRPYRRALAARYDASPRFRKIFRDMDLFWGVGAVVVGGVCLGVVLCEGVSVEVAYGVGWGGVPVWAGVWAGGTGWWVRRELGREREEWGGGGGGDGGEGLC